ncbi:MAG TPA: LPS export ABC transporter permease LptG [Pseudomonadales bacterium]|nr:LPS export ABC transporter permease LptG [Pseudomonadales bacterium]
MHLSLIKQHISRHVMSAVLLVLVVLMGLFAITLFAEEVNESAGHYGMKNILTFIALSLPGMAVSNTGFAMLIGCLMGLGVLANQSELTVMRTSGISVLRIIGMVLRPMLLLVLLSTLAGEYLVPKLDSMANRLRTEAVQQQSNTTLNSKRGLWLRQGNDFLHFTHILPDGTLYGFSRIAFDNEGKLQSVQYASKGIYSHGSASEPEGWKLDNVHITRFGADSTSNATQPEDAYWRSELAPELLGVVVTEPESMSLRELFNYTRYLQSHEQDNKQFALVFWQKALQPVAMIGLVIVAISFIFGPLREATMGSRLFTGVMVGVIFRFSQDLLGPVSMVYGFNPLIAVSAPIALCWLLGLLLLLRTR